MRNYIALLGWGYDESTTFFTTDELIEHFDLSRVSKNPAVFDEQKLRWMNGRYLRELPVEELKERLEQVTGRELPIEAVAISQDKMQTLADFWPLAGFLVERRDFDEQAWAKVMRDGAPERLREARAGARAGRAVRRRDGRAGAARGGRSPRRQAEGGLPPGARGGRRHDGLAGHLRVGCGTGAGGDPGAHRFCLEKASGG